MKRGGLAIGRARTDIKEAILDLQPTAESDDPVHERSLRAVVAEPEWGRQRRLWGRLPQEH